MQPKKKTSKARKGWRRSHHALTAPQVDHCVKCGAPKGAHSACTRCGYVHPRVSLPVEKES